MRSLKKTQDVFKYSSDCIENCLSKYCRDIEDL